MKDYNNRNMNDVIDSKEILYFFIIISTNI